ncbi:MAG: YggS family pyridoxal phosphate-dependent enzyme [Bacteroidales bacterium]|jgi:pyridoxal phosphate enzyme (YggS family)|nr:YggS family pyridoxal phosphate-dependent enzyme [Bacteroidales bacterium]
MSIASRIAFLKEKLPRNVTLVAVSKLHSTADIIEAYNAGQRIFGESRSQEMTSKHKILPPDLKWHFIGPLQSNKVRDIASFVSMIHSVDSLRLLREINKQAAKHARIINVLLEIHIAKEENKHGFTPSECLNIPWEEEVNLLQNIRICGLMGIATLTTEKDVIAQEFSALRNLWHKLKSERFNNNSFFTEISMGMTNDYEIAIAEGCTMVRIGSFIFS